MADCWEGAVLLAFHLCYFYFSAALIVDVPFPFGVRAGCGIRLYRFLIIAFLSTLINRQKTLCTQLSSKVMRYDRLRLKITNTLGVTFDRIVLVFFVVERLQSDLRYAFANDLMTTTSDRAHVALFLSLPNKVLL